MEVSTEISQKIRSAIKAKLMELGAYVDDELPDYIMVMVANKKSRSQMSSDLCLFLGTNTEAFTGWLHALLGKLQTITVESSEKMKAKVPKDGKKKDKKEGKEKKRARKHSSESLKKKPEFSDTSESSQIESKQIASSEITPEINTNKDVIIKSKSSLPIEPGSNSSPSEASGSVLMDNNETNINLQEDVEDVRQLLVTGAQADELAEELENTEEEVKKTLSEHSKINKSVGASPSSRPTIKEKDIDTLNFKGRSLTPEKLLSKVSATNRKRKVPISVVASVSRRSDHDEEEYDPYNPAVGSVASVVKVTSRKSSVPASLQANRTTEFKNSEDVQEPPEKMLKVSEAVSLDELKQVFEDVMKKYQESNDEIALFSKMVESALRKLKTQHLHLAKLKIQEVLFEFEKHDNGPVEVVKCSGAGHEVTCRLQEKETTEVSDKLKNSENKLTKLNELIHISTSDSLCQSKTVLNIELSQERERLDGGSKLAMARVPEPLLLNAQLVHVNNQLKTISSHDTGLVEDIVLQSPVSSSKLDSGSPSSLHSCPPSSTSGSDSLSLRRCIVSTSTQSPLSSRNSKLIESRPPATGTPNKSIPSIIVDSIHKRGRADSVEPVPVLKLIGNRPRGLQGATAPPECEEEAPRINPEALKVLAKNLKVTVVNKRAAQPQSSSEDSSSEETDEDESSDDEDVHNPDTKDETKKESSVDLSHENKDVGNIN